MTRRDLGKIAAPHPRFLVLFAHYFVNVPRQKLEVPAHVADILADGRNLHQANHEAREHRDHEGRAASIKHVYLRFDGQCTDEVDRGGRSTGRIGGVTVTADA